MLERDGAAEVEDARVVLQLVCRRCILGIGHGRSVVEMDDLVIFLGCSCSLRACSSSLGMGSMKDQGGIVLEQRADYDYGRPVSVMLQSLDCAGEYIRDCECLTYGLGGGVEATAQRFSCVDLRLSTALVAR